MRLAIAAVALGLVARAALSPTVAGAATLTRGTVEVETRVDLAHTAYSQSAVGSRTTLAAELSGAYSLTDRLQAGLGVLVGYAQSQADSVATFSYSSVGLDGDLTWNFPTPNNLVPFVRVGAGFERFGGDGYSGAVTSYLAPYLRAGVRAMVGRTASLNLSVGYQHVLHADGESGLDANVVSLDVGVSLFPVRGR